MILTFFLYRIFFNNTCFIYFSDKSLHYKYIIATKYNEIIKMNEFIILLKNYYACKLYQIVDVYNFTNKICSSYDIDTSMVNRLCRFHKKIDKYLDFIKNLVKKNCK